MEISQETKLQAIVERYRQGESSLVGLLQDIAAEYGYLPEDVLKTTSAELDVPLSLIFSLATFYKSFRLKPIGKNHVCVCVGTACHVRGAGKIVDALERRLNVVAGETTDDLDYTLETVNCLGACAMGPLVTINGEYHGKLDQKAMLKLIDKGTQQADSDDTT